MRSSRAGGTSPPGTAASSRVRSAGQHVAAAAQRLAGRAGQRDRLQQRHHRHQVVRAQLCHRQAGGAVRPDNKGKLGDELGHVQADLQVAGCHVAVARVEQHGLAVVGEQDATAVRPRCVTLWACSLLACPHIWLSSASVQPGFPLGQRRPLVVLIGQHGGFGTDPDHGAQPRRGRARVSAA